MILVEVQVPALQQTYEFSVDENRLIYDIILEMRQIISRKLREEEPDAWFELHSREQGRALPVDRPFSRCGILDGAKLILV